MKNIQTKVVQKQKLFIFNLYLLTFNLFRFKNTYLNVFTKRLFIIEGRNHKSFYSYHRDIILRVREKILCGSTGKREDSVQLLYHFLYGNIIMGYIEK